MQNLFIANPYSNKKKRKLTLVIGLKNVFIYGLPKSVWFLPNSDSLSKKHSFFAGKTMFFHY